MHSSVIMQNMYIGCNESTRKITNRCILGQIEPLSIRAMPWGPRLQGGQLPLFKPNKKGPELQQKLNLPRGCTVSQCAPECIYVSWSEHFLAQGIGCQTSCKIHLVVPQSFSAVLRVFVTAVVLENSNKKDCIEKMIEITLDTLS